MEVLHLEIRLKGIFPKKRKLLFFTSSPRAQPGILCTPVTPVKPLDALGRITKPPSLTMPHETATPLYKRHPFVYSRELLDSQATTVFRLPKGQSTLTQKWLVHELQVCRLILNGTSAQKLTPFCAN